MKQERLKSIEFLRGFFVLMVMVWHTRYLPWFSGDDDILKSDHAVEFFFLLSGLLMGMHTEKPMHGNLSRDCRHFIWHKIKSFYPMYLLAVVFDLLTRGLLGDHSVKCEELGYYIWDLLLLREAGFHGSFMTSTAIGSSWYLMAMTLAMAVLYPFLRANKDAFLHILAPLLVLSLYGWFSQTKGMLYFTLAFEHGVSLGLLRAIAGVSLGCLCYQVCVYLRRLEWNRFRLIRIVATLAECLAIYTLVYFSVNYKAGQYDFFCILMGMLLLIAEFGGFGLLNDLLKKTRTAWIGSFTLALYISHFTWIYVLIDLEPAWSREIGVAVFFGAAVLTAIGLMWTLKGIRWLLKQAEMKRVYE